MAGLVDTYIAYQLIKRLTTPFDKWDAYKHGIIDAEGNQLKLRKDLNSTSERDAFTYLDLLALNLKKLIGKLPGGQTQIASYAAALLLLKEYPKVVKEDESIFDGLEANLIECYNEAVLIEDLGGGVPVNNVGSGNIAGANGDPPVGKKAAKKYKDANAAVKNVRAILSRKAP